MRYGQIRKCDVANGEGVRTSVFVTGCTHRCPGCFNPEYQDFCAGEVWTDEQEDQVISFAREPYIAGVTLLGGEPMQNTPALIKLAQRLKAELPTKTLWIYSGYTFEEILTSPDKLELLSYADVLVDGRFVEALKDVRLKFRGSSNQRVLNVQESIKTRRPCWQEGYELAHAVVPASSHALPHSTAPTCIAT